MTTTAARTGRSFPSVKGIEQLIRDRVDHHRSAGIVAGVLDAGGSRVAAYGDPGPGRPPLSAETVFEIGSLTKVFTATLLAEMVQRGEVRLEEPVASLLPDQVPVPTRGRRQITLIDLATQTSGLPRLPTNLHLDPVAMGSYTIEQLYAFLSSYVLPRNIGEEYEYSNTGYGLLGHALALRAGRSYEDLLRVRILAPLGMADTAVTLTPAMEQRLALPHDDRGAVVAVWRYGALVATGAIYSTMTDMLRFAAANLDPTAGALQQAMALAQAPRRDAVGGMRIGLGWHTRPVIDWDCIWHSGETGGSRSFLGLDLERHRAAVVLSNSISRIEDVGFHLLDQRSELAQEEASIQLAPEVLERYVGVYALSPEGTLTVTRTDTGLLAEATGLGRAPLYAASETEFFVKVLPIRLTFSPGEHGAAMRVTLRFAGNQLTGVKVNDG